MYIAGQDVTDQLRSQDVGEAASKIAVYPCVREKLLGLQRELAGRDVYKRQVLRLRRVAVGSVRLGGLEEGEYRILSQKEIQALKDSVLIKERL